MVVFTLQVMLFTEMENSVCGDQGSLLGVHVVMKSGHWSVGRSKGLEQTLWNSWQDGGLKGRGRD